MNAYLCLVIMLSYVPGAVLGGRGVFLRSCLILGGSSLLAGGVACGVGFNLTSRGLNFGRPIATPTPGRPGVGKDCDGFVKEKRKELITQC